MSPQLVADRFEIERLVGAGGMGEVFRAKDRLTGGPVAIKVLHGSGMRDVDRFRREAQILAEVSHPRIVKYVAHGVSAGNRPYLAMEWLDGEDLGDRLAKQGLGLVDTIKLVKRVAEALAVLHDRGIVHRDIKPSNLFLVHDSVDELKVLDLGVARLLNASRPSTRSGIMVGTPGYMAPEQARGHKEIDARADIFSLGCVFFECLAGRPAFAGDNIAALLAKILLESPPSLRECDIDVPPALDDLVSRMLSKHSSSRPANGAAILRELDAFVGLQDSPPQRASVPVQRALTGSERRLVSVVMAAYGEPILDEPVPPSALDTVAASFDPKTIVASFGAEAEMLADGSIVVTLVGKGGASDQAAHAARCALALRSHMLTADVALATGLATVSGKNYVGDVIERAAAILAKARAERDGTVPGDDTVTGQSPVFLDETTAGLLDMRFDVGGDDRGLFIRGMREREGKARTLLGKKTPFVGRDRELSTLVGLWGECEGEPVARAVLVTGAPGAGKSRMLAEFLRRVREGTPTAEIWIARGDPMSEGSPFSLLSRMLRRVVGINGGEPLTLRQQKLRARVSRYVKEPDLERISEFLGEIVGVQFPDHGSVQLRAARQDSILMGDQMRRAFVDFVGAESKEAPVLVLLEDLHWGDLPSVGFVDSALRAATENPFMVVGAARSEIHEQFPHLWEQRSVQEIRLGPLVRRAAEALVKDVLGDTLDPSELARLLDRAGGNCFYLEELIRAYAEGTGSRAAAQAPGTIPPPPVSSARTLDSTDNWSLPGTVLAMVQARLERLDPMARRVLRAASVFGESFWRGSVIALTGGDCKASEIDDWLGELASREIIQRRDVSRFPAEQELRFRHAIMRDAAYEMLTPDDRALGHKLAGEWLERAGEDESMLLAEHFERAGALGKAVSFYGRAAAQALEGNDFAAARSRAERAIQAGAKGPDQGKLELLVAEAARWAGDHQAALSHASCAMRELIRGTDEWCAAAAEAVAAASTIGRVPEAREIAVLLSESTGTAAGVKGVAIPEMTAARVIAATRIVPRLFLAGAFAEADTIIRRVERDGHGIVMDDPAARAFVLAARVERAKWFGDVEEAAVLAREAVACFEEVGDARNSAVQRENAGFALSQLGLFAIAEPMLDQTIEDAERLGLAGLANEARLHLGQIYSRTLRKDACVKLLTGVIDGFTAQKDVAGEAKARAYLAGSLHLVGEFAAADAEAQRAIPLLVHAPTYLAPLYGLIALTRADRGELDAAVEAATEAIRILDATGGTIEAEGLVRIAYAEGLRAKGDIEGSKKAIAAARDRLLVRANKIKNVAWRRSFMEKIQEHQRILARAGEWLV